MPALPVPDQDDIALFHQTVGKVKPVVHDQAVTHTSKPKPIPRQSQADELAVLTEMTQNWPDPADMETGDELLFKRTGVQNTVLRKLQRGQYAIAAELDLHGMTAADAKMSLAAFLADCRLAGYRCIRVIHGKGLGSKDGRPVLKTMVAAWLQHCDDVLAYSSARPADGGTGAMYILLRRSRRN